MDMKDVFLSSVASVGWGAAKTEKILKDSGNLLNRKVRNFGFGKCRGKIKDLNTIEERVKQGNLTMLSLGEIKDIYS